MPGVVVVISNGQGSDTIRRTLAETRDQGRDVPKGDDFSGTRLFRLSFLRCTRLDWREKMD